MKNNLFLILPLPLSKLLFPVTISHLKSLPVFLPRFNVFSYYLGLGWKHSSYFFATIIFCEFGDFKSVILPRIARSEGSKTKPIEMREGDEVDSKLFQV